MQKWDLTDGSTYRCSHHIRNCNQNNRSHHILHTLDYCNHNCHNFHSLDSSSCHNPGSNFDWDLCWKRNYDYRWQSWLEHPRKDASNVPSSCFEHLSKHGRIGYGIHVLLPCCSEAYATATSTEYVPPTSSSSSPGWVSATAAPVLLLLVLLLWHGHFYFTLKAQVRLI